MLIAAAGDVRVPANPWPFQIALGDLRDRCADADRLGGTLATWPLVTSEAGRTYAGVDRMFHELLRAGEVRTEGHGWHAGYRATSVSLRRYRDLIAGLSSRDRRALVHAGQRLVACLTIWSKKAVASAPSGPGMV